MDDVDDDADDDDDGDGDDDLGDANERSILSAGLEE